MHRCFIDPGQWDDPLVALSEGESHHLLTVLRAREGEQVTVFDGRGRTAPARIAGVRPAELELTGPVAEHARPSDLTLIQAVPKGHRMDFIIEKGTELGMSRIMPVLTENTVTRPAGKQADNKLERWNKIALSAARQCGTPWLPDINPVTGLEQALDQCGGFDLLLVGSLRSGARRFKDVLAEKSEVLGGCPAIGVLIGPEGDFTSSEYELAEVKGAVPVSFGGLVLRVETASIYALSVLSYEL